MTHSINENESSPISLRGVREEDLPVFFEHQQDPVAIRMAAFTPEDCTDWEDFLAHWAKIRADVAIDIQTVLFEGCVAGHVSKYETQGEPEITYWIGREYWDRGIATQALSQFLHALKTCPLYAHVVQDNAASRRVLEKCGFIVYGSDRGYANGRGTEVDELLLRLDADLGKPI